MAKCKNCARLEYRTDWRKKGKYPWCQLLGDSPDLEFERFCGAFKKQTNADRIRAMSNEELAEFLCLYDVCVMCSHNSDNMCSYKNCNEIGLTEKWLKSEVGCE